MTTNISCERSYDSWFARSSSSVELYQYSSEDVAGLNNKIPSLFAVQGTAKLHEFLTKKVREEVYLFVKIFPMRRVEKLY